MSTVNRRSQWQILVRASFSLFRKKKAHLDPQGPFFYPPPLPVPIYLVSYERKLSQVSRFNESAKSKEKRPNLKSQSEIDKFLAVQ